MSSLDMFMSEACCYPTLSSEEEDMYLRFLSDKNNKKLLTFDHLDSCDKPTLKIDLLFTSFINSNEYQSIIKNLIDFYNGLESKDKVTDILRKYQIESNKLGRALNRLELKNIFDIKYDGETLSNDELLSELELFVLYKTAFEKMLLSNFRLVFNALKLVTIPQKISKEDLISDGTIALMRAIIGFDISRKNKFSTYATSSIIYSMIRFIKKNRSNIKLPETLCDEIGKFATAVGKLRQEKGRELTIDEIAEELSISKEKVITMLISLSDDLSINQIIGNDGEFTIENTIPSKENVEDEVMRKCLKEDILVLLDVLDERCRDIIKMKYGLGEYDGMIFENRVIAKKYNVSPQRISELSTRSIYWMKEAAKKSAKQKSIGEYYYN